MEKRGISEWSGSTFDVVRQRDSLNRQGHEEINAIMQKPSRSTQPLPHKHGCKWGLSCQKTEKRQSRLCLNFLLS